MKGQSKQSTCPGERAPKKVKTVPLARIDMATMGLARHNLRLSGKGENDHRRQYYANLLDLFHTEFMEMRYELLYEHLRYELLPHPHTLQIWIQPLFSLSKHEEMAW